MAASPGPMHGPFHRVETPTQTTADAVTQTALGEIWGRAAYGSGILSVKAYRNAIPSGARGIEFTTPTAPHRGGGTPYEAKWYHPNTPGVLLRVGVSGEHFAAIKAIVDNRQP